MPWCYRDLKGKRVLARCDADGNLVAERGRVEVRYTPSDGRSYRAGVHNLRPLQGGAGSGAEVLPDAHCAPANPAPPKNKPKRPVPSKTPDAPSAPAGDEVLIYADGACRGNPGPAGLGVVAMWGAERWELSEFLGEGTNNIAELTAILRALERVRDLERPVRLYTDSRYAIGVLTQGWKAKANTKLVEQLREVAAGFSDLRLHHVRGHQGVELNERADELARRAVDESATGGWVGGRQVEAGKR